MNEKDVEISTPFDETCTLSDVVSNARVSLHTTIEARKQTQRDAQLLLNRIQLLRNEEAKAIKHIAVARHKAENMSFIRAAAAKREADRSEVERRRQLDLISAYQRNSYFREAAKANRAASIQEMKNMKQQAALETRSAIRSSAIERVSELVDEKKTALRRTELIRQQRIDAKRRMEAEKVDRLRKFQQEFESKLAKETQLKIQSESILAQLEREELELIRRLQRVQQEQTSVLDELSMTLPPSTPPITKSSPPLSTSSRNSPITSSRISHNHCAPTLASLSRRDLGGAAMR